MNFSEYYDKVLGCYIGKNIGGTLGAPFECFRGEFNLTWFAQNISEPIPNDDLDLQLVWLRAVEIEGKNIDSHVLAEYWNTYVSATLAEYGTSKNNYNMGILPPLSGVMRNINKNSNGAWIRSEIWACLCAGHPALAATYAYYDSSVDHGEEGVYSAVFCAAIQAAAFVETDIYKLIDIGLSYIPKGCAVERAIKCVLCSYKEGKTWQQARKALFKETPCYFGMLGGYWRGTAEVPASAECPVQELDPEIPDAQRGSDAPWSIGAVILAMLYGEGDFGKTVCTATNCGEDTDCTAGTAGALFGIIYGASKLPEKWKNACSNRIATWTLRMDQYLCPPKTIEEFAYRIVKQTPIVLGNYCKLVSDLDSSQKQPSACYEIKPANKLGYVKGSYHVAEYEDIKVLIAEQGRVLRKRFNLYNVLVAFEEGLAKVEEGVEKRLELTFLNRLFTPQYLTIRFLNVPEEWTVVGGVEFCVGLEHWHGGINRNSYLFRFIPQMLNKGRYTLIMEIESNGRMSKNYLPLTFINGSC